jgi:serine/threonine protein kinase
MTAWIAAVKFRSLLQSYKMTYRQTWDIDKTSKSIAGNQGVVACVIRRTDGVLGALKVLKTADLCKTERTKRFQMEIAALKHLGCPGVPRILEDGYAESGAPYFIAEWMQGETLQRYVSGNALALESALAICDQLINILEQVHAQEVVHRDIKPDNMILSRDGRLSLVDFGIAWFNQQDLESELTEVHGTRLGNFFLILPEFYGSQDKRDHRSDLTFAVGILFYMLTGAKPVQLRDAGVRPPHRTAAASKFRDDAVADPRWPLVQSIFDVGFSINPDRRYQTAAELRAALHRVINFSNSNQLSADTRLREALASHHAARVTMDEQIDEIEQDLLGAVVEIASGVGAIAREHGFDGPVNQSAVDRPGEVVSVLWQFKRIDHNEPKIFYRVTARLVGEEKNSVELRLTAVHREISTLDNLYYTGRSADVAGLILAGKQQAPQIVADVLIDLTSKFPMR